METLIIDRTKWTRGEKGGASQLLNADGNMCCLGFDALRRGFKREDILCQGTPLSVFYLLIARIGEAQAAAKVKELFGPLIDPFIDNSKIDNSAITSLAMRINDNCNIDESEREIQLSFLFRAIGIDVRFVGIGFPEEFDPKDSEL